MVPDSKLKELSPASHIITEQNRNNEVNKRIISIYGMFDNHVWPTKASHLDGAENIQIKVDGHHKMLWHKSVRDLIVEKINALGENK